MAYAAGDWLVFGSESRGLDPSVRDRFDVAHRLRLPMRPGNRSLNLSNAVAIVVYEAWRQVDRYARLLWAEMRLAPSESLVARVRAHT